MKATIESELLKTKNSKFDSDQHGEEKRMFDEILNAPIKDQFQFDLDFINRLAEKQV